MKKISVLLILLLTLTSVFAQSDFSVTYLKPGNADAKAIPWYCYFGERVAVDFRYNFDCTGSTAAFGGYTFPMLECLSLTPMFGIIAGPDWNGGSIETYLNFNYNRLSSVMLLQYAGAGRDDLPNFFYFWGDYYYQIANHVQIGFGSQVYRETSADFRTKDLGPLIKISCGRFYFKPWYTSSVLNSDENTDKLFLVGGVTF